uniref:TLDc domain-containing protein n=1 Tax=Toxocara canis TaxID=6265 RepID=A0A183V266_TOXCA
LSRGTMCGRYLRCLLAETSLIDEPVIATLPLSRLLVQKFALTDYDDCFVEVKEVTETDGTVSGTLLVTPNALMFDPDVTHPLVVENGQDLYMMMAHMDEIMSVAVFKDIEALMCEADSADKMYDPEHVRTPSVGQSPSRVIVWRSSRAQVGLEFQKNAMDETRNVFDADVEDSLRERAPPEGSVNDSSKTEGIFATVEHGEVISAGLSILGESAGGLPEIAEEEREGKKQFEATSPLATSTRRAFSETTPEREINVGFAVSERDQPNVPLPPIQGKQETDQTRMQSDLQSRISTTSLPRFSSASSSSSLSRLGRTLRVAVSWRRCGFKRVLVPGMADSPEVHKRFWIGEDSIQKRSRRKQQEHPEKLVCCSLHGVPASHT